VQPFHGELVLLDPPQPQRQETGGQQASRPQPAFDADLDDDVPF
jgi:hypothetical protein